MDPSAIHNLLLNLKLQLLALPNLLRWGLVAFAGVIITRQAITWIWNARQRGKSIHTSSGASPGSPAVSAGEELPALPAPDPLKVHFTPASEILVDRPIKPPQP